MPYLPYVAHDPLYRSKMTAVAEGESLRLRLLLHNDAKCTSAFLEICPDGGESFSLEMGYKCPSDENYNWWECEFSLSEGLYWYSFYYFGEGGKHYVTKHERGIGLVSGSGGKWQLTIYSRDFETPLWPQNGIIYQIFPDRFFASGEEKKNIPADRFIRNDWGATPAWKNDGSEFSICNDYFCGDIRGIIQKLDYIEALGASCIYLNPIFEAHSNHRYNTADYMQIDPLLGTTEEFKELCQKAKERGIGIILDGVFSHTGADSRYFNKNNRYNEKGAWNNPDSPYRSWFNFDNSPIGYHSWWGVPSLPETNELDPAYDNFINGKEGVVRHWLKAGAMGWRLDVADELPDGFLDSLRRAAKAENRDCFILGEVWEDATSKISYSKRRRFLRGKQLDSVMNYPFANAIIGFIKGKSGYELMDTVLDIIENYPPQAINLLMNHIGTHDTPRALTALADSFSHNNNRAWQAEQKLGAAELDIAKKRLKCAAILQYTLPGIPSVFYGDEAGAEGYSDPFCRGCFPWDNIDTELLDFYKALGQARKHTSAFQGEFIPVYESDACVVFMRRNGNDCILAAVNRGSDAAEIQVDSAKSYSPILGEAPINGAWRIEPLGYSLLEIK